MAQSIDRRILKTRLALLNALLKLSGEMPFAQISVTELTEAANIARPTFYRHYSQITDILEDELDFRAEQFMIELAKKKPGKRKLEEIMLLLLNHFFKNESLFLVLYKAGMDNYILDRFAAYSTQMIEISAAKSVAREDMPQIWHFAGGTHNLFKNWLINGKHQPLSELAAIMAVDLRNIFLDNAGRA